MPPHKDLRTPELRVITATSAEYPIDPPAADRHIVRGSAPSRHRTRILHVVGPAPAPARIAPVLAAPDRRRAFEQLVLHVGEASDWSAAAAVLRGVGRSEPDHWILPEGAT